MRHAAILTLAILLFCLSVGTASAAEPLLFRGDQNYPPYEFLDETGHPTGFNVDITQAVARVMGLDIEMSLAPWDTVRRQIEARNIDALMGMYKSEQRAQMVNFSEPTIEISHAIFVREESSISGKNDLNGKSIIVQQGDIMHDFLIENRIQARIVTTGDQAEALKLLSSGKYDCALVARLQGLYFRDKLGLHNLVTVGPPLAPRNYCFAVNKGNTALLARINEGLAIIKQSGEYNEIYHKWFGAYAVRETDSSRDMLMLAGTILAAGLAVMFLGTTLFWRGRARNLSRNMDDQLEMLDRFQSEQDWSEARYEALSDLLRDGVTLLQTSPRKYVHANPAFCQLTGFSREEILGRDANSLFGFVHPEDRHMVRDRMETLHADPACPSRFDFRILRTNGELLWITASSCVLERNGQSWIQTIYNDATSRIQSENDILKARNEVENAQRAKEEFLANLSHVIRTPLNGLLGMLQLLRKMPLTSTQEECVEISLDSGRSIMSTINDLLMIARFESGFIPLDEHPFSVKNAVRTVVAGFMPHVREKGLELTSEIGPEVPGELIGDRARLRHILFNLTDNAVKFTRSGNISISVHALPVRPFEEGVRLLFTVSDSGAGIADTEIDLAFNRFHVPVPDATRRHPGMGVGLSIVRRLVESMGGTITVDSTLGKGTTVMFTAAFLKTHVVLDELPQSARDYEESPPPASLRVLLVEDDLVNRLAARRFLEKAGAEVTAVENGEDAVNVFEKENFDCILMDIQMPVMDGFEATRRIRRSTTPGRNPKIPIIALTAHALAGDREKILAAGMDDYLAKPIELESLSRIIATHVRSDSAESEAAKQPT
ncbi:transporter substrate-binding domain-containing protein [Pseudodesulfovibrio tunisiensis]|uniref:transporter substrate-binding domain-containing protein n=1 Tax=Pseudodesulfovibrio tunisiensis TaxID=463192 RepID=UPI001FB1F323|nr:transporter substrate-binding domain-containing protein [Pseudodesulfovibrio tunisiensis]